MGKVYREGKQIVRADISAEFEQWYHAQERIDFNKNRAETRRHQSLSNFEISDESLCPQSFADRFETVRILKAASGKLTPKQRTVVILHAIHKMTFREIGARLDISKQSAHEIYVAGISKLKKICKKSLFR